MKLDKLTLLMSIPQQHQDGIKEHFIKLVGTSEYQTEYGFSRAYGAGCCGYAVSLACRVPLNSSTTPPIWSKDTAFLIQVGAKRPGAAPVRIDINPLGLTPTGVAHLREVIDGLAQLGWENLRHCRVSRVDIAIDVDGVWIGDRVWDMPKRPTRESISCKGMLRSLYIGAKRARPLMVYDKARQLSLPVGTERTRIEFRSKEKVKLSELPDMTNPFARVLVFDPRKIAHPWPEMQKHSLLSVGHHGGRGAILGLCPKGMCASIRVKLEQTAAPWWNPTNVWSRWPDALSSTLPGLVSAKAQDKLGKKGLQLIARPFRLPGVERRFASERRAPARSVVASWIAGHLPPAAHRAAASCTTWSAR